MFPWKKYSGLSSMDFYLPYAKCLLAGRVWNCPNRYIRTLETRYSNPCVWLPDTNENDTDMIIGNDIIKIKNRIELLDFCGFASFKPLIKRSNFNMDMFQYKTDAKESCIQTYNKLQQYDNNNN